MANRFQFTGLRELKADLRRLPAELRDEGRAIVVDAANAAADELRSKYPEGPTGNLRRGVRVVQATEQTKFGIAMKVKSVAPHAIIYERGSELRRYRGASRGKMRPTHLFARTLSKHRREMYERLAELVRSKFEPGAIEVG